MECSVTFSGQSAGELAPLFTALATAFSAFTGAAAVQIAPAPTAAQEKAKAIRTTTKTDSVPVADAKPAVETAPETPAAETSTETTTEAPKTGTLVTIEQVRAAVQAKNADKSHTDAIKALLSECQVETVAKLKEPQYAWFLKKVNAL